MNAKLPSDAARLRPQAERECYGDVRKPCGDAVPACGQSLDG